MKEDASFQRLSKYPVRIVLLDDSEDLRQMYVSLLRCCFPLSTILEFENGDDAWRELARNNHDLLITDYNHLGLSCAEIFDRFVRIKINCQIFVVSGFAEGLRKLEERRDEWSRLKITFVEKPFDPEAFRKVIEYEIWTTRESAHREFWKKEIRGFRVALLFWGAMICLAVIGWKKGWFRSSEWNQTGANVTISDSFHLARDPTKTRF